jgi:hypothetical protein
MSGPLLGRVGEGRKCVEAAHLPHLGQLFVLRDIDVRLGDTNGKEASLERALDSSATASRGFLPLPITCSILPRATGGLTGISTEGTTIT